MSRITVPPELIEMVQYSIFSWTTASTTAPLHEQSNDVRDGAHRNQNLSDVKARLGPKASA